MRILTVGLAALWLSVSFAGPGRTAAQPSSPPPPLPPTAAFRHLTIDDGLADQVAAEITQDAEGFMWFGTFSGLDRYDGYRFVQYRHDDADVHSLSGNIITALYTDRAGNVWVGARGAGVNRFDPRTQQFERFQHDAADPASLSNDSPHMIYQDASGAVWIASEGGLSRLNPDGKTFTNYRHDDADPTSIGSNAVRSIAEDASGTLWLGTANGLSRFDRAAGQFTTYRRNAADPQSPGSNVLFKVVVDHVGMIWLATDNGLDSLDPRSGRFTHYRNDPSNPHSLSSNSLDALMEDDVGRLWAGTFGGGVSILDVERQSFTVYRNDPGNPSSLSYDQVDKIFRDRSGLVWLGTGGGGIDMYNPEQQAVTIYRPVPGDPRSLASLFAYSVLEDRDGITWVGTRNAGLDRFDRRTGHVTHYPAQPGVAGQLGWPAIEDLQQDKDGAIWLAAYGGGLYRLDPATGHFTLFKHDADDPHSLSHDNVRKLSFDEHGNLWIATTGGGLNMLDPATGRFTTYHADPGDPRALANNLTVGLDADQHGGVWVGTSGDGLARLDIASGQFTRYEHDPLDPTSLTEDNVFAIHVDRAGFVWVGTQGNGLDRLDPSTGMFAHYHQTDGLPSERIQSIVEDGSPGDPSPGNLWIVTDRGVARISADRRALQAYGTANGLPQTQFTMGAYLDTRGELLVGSLVGLIVFDPMASHAGFGAPPVVLTDLQVNNKNADRSALPQELNHLGRFELPYSQRIVSFEFAALDFREPRLNRYRYKLEGFDADWTEVDAERRVATYTNLDPGTYMFRVSASNPDGMWNETGRSIELVVTPPWWATWWFRGVAVVAVIGALGGLYLLRELALRRQRRQLEVLVDQRTEALKGALTTRDVFLRTVAHDLKAPMVSLRWQAQILGELVRRAEAEPSALIEASDAIAAGADEVVESIDELHDLTQIAAGEQLPLRYERLDLVALCAGRVNVRRQTSRHPIQFHSTQPVLMIRADRARLGRVVDNLLDNATKFSPPQAPVEVRLSQETRSATTWAVLQVCDHGIGIPAADVPHVFEQYHRGANAGSVLGEGLGLASARHLVLLHSGALEVESQEGSGSTFTVRLPIQ